MASYWSNVRTAAAMLALGVGIALAADKPATQPLAAGLETARRVTLKYNDAPAKEIFAALGREAGVVIRTSPKDLWDKHGETRLSVSLNDVTFWTAMRELCEKSGLTVQRVGNEEALRQTVEWYLEDLRQATSRDTSTT